MNVQLMFWISLTVAAIGFVGAIINMLAAGAGFKSGSFKGVLIRHILAGICYVSGIIGIIGFGIAWLAQYLKH
jgi:hypothetical protein